jgi:uncharacterized protein (UPF0276 family)
VNRFGLPMLGIGLGLRARHYAAILASEQPQVGWFEIISENYMQTSGRPLLYLDRIKERYPIVMHGVSLSIGSTDPLEFEYLRELKALRDRVGARWVSDHLCWTGAAHLNTHDLLPLPYTDEALRHVARRVRTVQDFLEAPLALENPSTYLEFEGGSLKEWEFMRALAEEADSAILLDVNNVYVSAHNHGFDPLEYLNHIAYDRVVQFHVAGHSQGDGLLIDTHIGPVIEPVWQLFAEAHAQASASVLLEWDAEIPAFEVALAEALRARAFMDGRGMSAQAAGMELVEKTSVALA